LVESILNLILTFYRGMAQTGKKRCAVILSALRAISNSIIIMNLSHRKYVCKVENGNKD